MAVLIGGRWYLSKNARDCAQDGILLQDGNPLGVFTSIQLVHKRQELLALKINDPINA
jgi:hypothetical protein